MSRTRHPKSSGKMPPNDPAVLQELVSKIRIPTERKITRREGQQQLTETVPLNIRTTPIVWGIPGDEIMFFRFFSNFVRMNFMPWDTFATTESTYLPSARNDIHNSFLDTHPDWKHLMMLDSDVLAAPWTVSQLLHHNLDCVGGWYHMKGPQVVDGVLSPVPAVYAEGHTIKDDAPYYNRFDTPGTGLQKIGAIGMGCVMMSRSLCEDIGRSPYHMGNGAGEDMNICQKITDKGYDIWVDWELRAAHVGVSWV